MIRGERAVDRQRAAVEVDERRTSRGPAAVRRRTQHTARARGGIERQAEGGVLGDHEAARVDTPRGADQRIAGIGEEVGPRLVVAVVHQDTETSLGRHVTISGVRQVDATADRDHALLGRDVEDARTGAGLAGITVGDGDIVAAADEVQVSTALEIKVRGAGDGATGEVEDVRDDEVLARGADGTGAIVGTIATTRAELERTRAERAGGDDRRGGRTGPEGVAREEQTSVLEHDATAVIVRREAVDAVEEADDAAVHVGRVSAAELDLARAGDIADDVQRADRGTVDRTEHVIAARAVGGHLDGAGDLVAVERARDDVGGARARRIDLQVATEGHVAAQEEDGAVGDGEGRRAGAERATGGERVGTEDQSSGGERGRPLEAVVAREEERARTGLDQVAADGAGNAAEEAHHRRGGPAVIRVDVDRVGGGDAARREVDATQEEEVAIVAITAHQQVGDEVDLILQRHLVERAIDTEGAEAGDLVDGDLPRAEREVAGRLDVGAGIDDRTAGVVIAIPEGDARVPGAGNHVTVDHRRGRRAVFGHVGAEDKAVATREDVLETVVTEDKAMLVAAEADAVDAVGARAEGRGEVDGRITVVVGTAAAAGTEPELTAAGRGLDRAHVEGVVLPAAAEADAAEVAAGGGEADLTRGRGRGDEAGELGLRDVVADHHAGEGVAVGLRDDLLRSDVGRGQDIDHRARVEDDVPGAEGRAGTGQALDRAGGVVAITSIDIEAEQARGAEGIARVGELERTVAELGDASAGDDAFEDRATGVEELRVEDVIVRAEGGRAGEGEVARGIEGDRRGGAQVGEDQVAEALLVHVTAITVRAVEDGRIAGERDRAREVTRHLDTAGQAGIATRGGGDVGRQVETRAVEDDVLAVGDRVDRRTGAGDRIDQAEDALIDDDVTRDGVATLEDEITRTELDEAGGGDLRVDRGGIAVRDIDVAGARARGAEEQLHRGGALLRGAVGRGADRGLSVEKQAAGDDRQGITRDVRLDVRVRAQRIDAGVVGRAEGLGGRDIHGRRTRREIGRGEVGPGGGPAGDLYVEIVERPHEYLVRDGDDLHIQIGISMAHAALGTRVQVEGLDGTIDVEIKPGIQSGSPILLKGKGVTHLRSTSRGDLIVHVEVQTPLKLNREQEELLQKFADARGEKQGDVHLSNREGGLFGKLRGAFHR